MDSDGSGDVTKAEFITFMLVAMNKVDSELVDKLGDVFNRLDKDDSGTLDKEDLVMVAKQKLKSPERLMELRCYKQQLLRQAASARHERRRSSKMTQRSRNGSRRSSLMSMSDVYQSVSSLFGSDKNILWD